MRPRPPAPETTQAPTEKANAKKSVDEGAEGGDASADAPPEDVNIQADLGGETKTPTGVKREVVIRSFGDIIIHEPLFDTAYDEKTKTFDFSPYFTLISDSLAKADYTVGNVDGPMGGKGSRGYKFYPQFNTPPHLLHALKGIGIDMLTLANNHALDTFFDGLKREIANVEKVGIDHVGAYRTQKEYDTPKVVDIKGIKVGITNYTVSTNNLENSSDPEATEYGLRTTRNSSPKKDIAALRKAGAEFVVVYMHWGEEYVRDVTNSQKDLAKKLVAAGRGHDHRRPSSRGADHRDGFRQGRGRQPAQRPGGLLHGQLPLRPARALPGQRHHLRIHAGGRRLRRGGGGIAPLRSGVRVAHQDGLRV